MKLVDRIGDRYERLVVIERAPNGNDTNARWLCRCDCGKTAVAYGGDLRRGKVKSCGCLNAERIETHGMSRTHVYGVWKGIHQRCGNEKAPSFENYGGRGITVCSEWASFERFYEDMGDRPKAYTLDRIDNSGPYSKANCRWATVKQQCNNTRRNRVFEYDGRTQTLAEWAGERGMDWHTLRQRIDRLGWSIEDAITRQVSKRKR